MIHDLIRMTELDVVRLEGHKAWVDEQLSSARERLAFLMSERYRLAREREAQE